MSFIMDRHWRAGSILTKLLISLEAFNFLVLGYYIGAFRIFLPLSILTEGDKGISIDLGMILKVWLFY